MGEEFFFLSMLVCALTNLIINRPWIGEMGFAFEKDMHWWKCSYDCSHGHEHDLRKSEEAEESLGLLK